MSDPSADVARSEIHSTVRPDFQKVAESEYDRAKVHDGIANIAIRSRDAIQSRNKPEYKAFKKKAMSEPAKYSQSYAKVEGLRFGYEKVLDLLGQDGLVDSANRDGLRGGGSLEEYGGKVRLPEKRDEFLPVIGKLGTRLSDLYIEVAGFEAKSELNPEEAREMWQKKGLAEAYSQALFDMGFIAVQEKAYAYATKDNAEHAKRTERSSGSGVDSSEKKLSPFETALEEAFQPIESEYDRNEVTTGIAALAAMYGGYIRESRSSHRDKAVSGKSEHHPTVIKFQIADQLGPLYKLVLLQLGQRGLVKKVDAILSGDESGEGLDFEPLLDYALRDAAPKLASDVSIPDNDTLKRVALQIAIDLPRFALPIEKARQRKMKDGSFSQAYADFDKGRANDDARKQMLTILGQHNMGEIASREGTRIIHKFQSEGH